MATYVRVTVDRCKIREKKNNYDSTNVSMVTCFFPAIFETNPCFGIRVSTRRLTRRFINVEEFVTAIINILHPIVFKYRRSDCRVGIKALGDSFRPIKKRALSFFHAFLSGAEDFNRTPNRRLMLRGRIVRTGGISFIKSIARNWNYLSLYDWNKIISKNSNFRKKRINAYLIRQLKCYVRY